MKKLKIVFMCIIMIICLFGLSKKHISEASGIEDGEYIIRSSINENYVLDVTGASMMDKARLELWNYNGGNNQIFIIKKIGNNQYTITAKHSNKNLDIPYGSKENGTIIEQYSKNNGDNQVWYINEDGSGYYNIISKCNGLNMDIANAIMKNGIDIVMWKNHGGQNQKYKLQRVTQQKNENIDSVEGDYIEDGIYQIKSALNLNYVLDITGQSKQNCANVEIWGNNNQNNQKYSFKNVGNNFYEISCVDSKKYLDVEGDSKQAGGNLIQYSYNKGDNQKWYLKKVGDGYYCIMSKSNKMCIDIDHGIIANGSNVLLWPCNNSKNQVFKIEKTDSITENIDKGRSEQFKLEHPDIKVGIDVSRYQEVIDWNAVKKDGIDYAMIRAGFRGYGESGSLNEDTMFEQNVKGARAAGLDVGVYFFSQAKNYDEGVKEAEYTINLIKKFDITYPVAFDTEDSSSPTHTGRADNISVQDRTDATKGFCSTIESYGYNTLIYASPSWLKDNLYLNQLSQYKIWLANYTGATQDDPLKRPPNYKGDYVMWQYTDSGEVNGIKGGVDCIIYYYQRDK